MLKITSHSRNIYLLALLISGILLSFTPSERNKEETRALLYGIWVHDQDGDNSSLRYVKADSWKKDQMGFDFQEEGILLMRMPLGCPTPKPNMQIFRAGWTVKSANRVEIDQHYPGEPPLQLRIEKLNNRVLRFNW